MSLSVNGDQWATGICNEELSFFSLANWVIGSIHYYGCFKEKTAVWFDKNSLWLKLSDSVTQSQTRPTLSYHEEWIASAASVDITKE